jgi:signal transduction histidine kinase
VGEDPDLAPLARAFNDTAETLQTRVERDARFAADVSHELRSPLTTMVNAMAVLDHRRGQLTGNARQALDLLSSDLTRFQHLVDDLLEISLADDSGSADKAEPVDLGAVVGEIARHYPIPAGAVVETTGRSMMILGDRRRLERAITNLVVNAQQHGGGLHQLSVRAGGADNVRIEVDDAGPGVPDEDKLRIFERFARGSPATRRSSDAGSGLGLALVAQHARDHGGHTWVEDCPTGGARFVIEIPRYQS